jgi:SAM-dependent methyltransferase
MAKWFETLFDENYVAFYEELQDRDVATKDAEFVDRALALPARARVLDLGCGFGRHSVSLALRGHRVTGLDLSRPLLNIARDLAKEYGVDVTWVERDMRELHELDAFDACVSLYTVFGYFDDDSNEHILRDVFRVLRPGGLFLLDVSNPLALVPHWPLRTFAESATGIRLETADYDGITGRVRSRRTLIRPGGTRMDLADSDVRLYPPYELARLLRGSGFTIEQSYGGLRDEPLNWQRSQRQVWIARRPLST